LFFFTGTSRSGSGSSVLVVNTASIGNYNLQAEVDSGDKVKITPARGEMPWKDNDRKRSPPPGRDRRKKELSICRLVPFWGAFLVFRIRNP
jgi:hypothetical protein